MPSSLQRLEPKAVDFTDLMQLYGCANEPTCDASVFDRFQVLARGADTQLVDTRPWSNQTFVMLSYAPAHAVISCDKLFGFAQRDDKGWMPLDLPFSADDIGGPIEECEPEFAVFRLGDKPYLAAHNVFPPYRLATPSNVNVIRSVFDAADASGLGTRQCIVSYSFAHHLATDAKHPVIEPQTGLREPIVTFLDSKVTEMFSWVTLREEVGETVYTDTRFVAAASGAEEVEKITDFLSAAPQNTLSKQAVATLPWGVLNQLLGNEFERDAVNWETRFFPVTIADRVYIAALMKFVGPGDSSRVPLVAVFRPENGTIAPVGAFRLRIAFQLDRATPGQGF